MSDLPPDAVESGPELPAAAIADPPAAVPMTAGQQLRAAREARHMSVADVAEVLRFSVRQVEAIEADRYADLPGATLVRGFVRGYAKLLKLDAGPLLAAMAEAVPQGTADVRPPQTLGAAEDAPALDRVSAPGMSRGVWGLAAVLVVAVGLIAYLVFSSEAELPSVASYKMSQESPAAVPAVAPPLPPATGTGAVPDAIQQPAPAVATAAAPATEAPAGTAASGLVVEFDERSWIEVRDAASKVVLVGEYSKGARQAVEGKAPFQLWIGKASVVRVSYRDQRIDLKPYTREEVARLTVE